MDWYRFEAACRKAAAAGVSPRIIEDEVAHLRDLVFAPWELRLVRKGAS